MSAPRATRLAVGLYGRRIGNLERDAGRLTFKYSDEYASGQNLTPLSLSMPVGETTYRNRPIEAYLRGLMPDHKDVRERWARRYGVKDRDSFGLIAAIGTDCAGAAIFAPEDEFDHAMSGQGGLEPLDEGDIAARLRSLRADDSNWQEEDEHWSLAGGQGKFALTRTDGSWSRPTGPTPSTHIVKPGIASIGAQALSEHICLTTYANIGMSTAKTEYVEFEDQPAIVVERYDRRIGPSGAVTRIHQEDMCQVFAIGPSKKYQTDGGPDVRRISERLLEVADEESNRRFARAVIVNYLIGAPDAHAKNYSIMLIGNSSTLAPVYDIVSGLIPGADGALRYPKVAMSIGGEMRIGEVEGKNWARFATACGLDEDDIRSMVHEAARDIPDAMNDAMSTVPRAAGIEMLRQELLPRVARLCEVTVAAMNESRRTNGRVTEPVLGELQSLTRPTTGIQGRQPLGTPTGGQYTHKVRRDSGLTLPPEDD